MPLGSLCVFFFFFNDTATTEIYTRKDTLSLHDALPISVVSAEQCRRAKPRFVAACGSGVLVHVVVPVQNRICRFYRDDEIRVQLQYDDRNRLARMVTEMNPFRSLPLPWLGFALHWAR